MIIVRSPLRLSLGGGGTDLPSYYREYGGFLVAGAIDRYVYVTVAKPFKAGIVLKYSEMEDVVDVDAVQQPIIREALRLMEFRAPQIEITTIAEIPSGTGLGSSGSFATALLKALHVHRRKTIQPSALAEMACDIEINRLKEPVGKQDQYIAACGGLTCFTFERDDSVKVEPLNVSSSTLFEMEDKLLLFFTGFSRRAGSILEDQRTRSVQSEGEMLENLHYVKTLGYRSRELIEAGRMADFGLLMHEHWEHKKRRSAGMSNPKIDQWYELGMANGALGGKLVGAGGGGFLLFYAADRDRLRQAMSQAGLQEVRCRFDFEGTKVLVS